ncbi:NUDIX domain-containing protein [Demequina sp. SO4-18]|uniref:NUDIX domain-containing protein n=1 Tax=Demequina sp. SO4-18 TaxID=3401026 RepID=UPI003B59888D
MSPDSAARGTPPPGRERDPGDAWVEAPGGERYWGRYGAAGVLAVDPSRGVLLQHRAEWSHHGGTWGIPGGALHQGETAEDGALREALEEAGVPRSAVRTRAVWRVDRQVWAYTTLMVDVVKPFDAVAGDAESLELLWVAAEQVDALPLHPAFARAWPSLRHSIRVRPRLVVDAANVVGSVPDGWWRDRRGAAERLMQRLEDLGHGGVGAAALGLDGLRWHPGIDLVVEGEARGLDAQEHVSVIDAPGSGDDSIVARVRELAAGGVSPVVVTSDAELRSRAQQEGASVHGARWLLDLLDALDSATAGGAARDPR